MSDDTQVLDNVGPRLRAFRQAIGLTLADLAEQTGLTTSTISRLERSQIRPTLEQLLPLARVYGVPLDDLVAAPATGDPRVHLRPVRRAGLTFIPLGMNRGELQAFKVVYPPVDQMPPAKFHSHAGREWFYVISGAVRLVLADRTTRIVAGEAAEFDTKTPHWIGNDDADAPAEILAVYGRQGGRMHLTDV